MVTECGRVLVTRPAGQADSLLARLEQAGYSASHQPLLALAPLAELAPSLRQRVLDLDLYAHVIFISGNAVRYGLSIIDDYWPQLPTGINWYAIGGTTARLLAERGLVATEPGAQMNSEGLLAVPALQQVVDQRVLIVKGQGGRELLQSELTARGARVDELACYSRACPPLEQGALARTISEGGIETVLISSGEGLQNMLTLLSGEETTKFRDVRLVVPSLRVEKLAREAGFTQIDTAANASDEAMMAALQGR
ncbi:hypothetical protein BST95_05735 [Halioglobus japonicus]|uniref:Uroporphyrinogen-III synthase n=1 Tax=Halioglobus japonicus TaxID=930805 RepID=A0AAP8MDP9_9GAMM|nr:uroporphyrinogen-III synthase [Halioglobus japonicus]AQA17807.1 hypothetical protein BST95_05735 [Halioglobus japonicus]PLW85764.1 uroporphyrinogen-III synthase [Halioglobus japonicus]GHD17387.1 uroporphyrinogen-III synthase [Halioglobus japonicus]